MRGDYIHWDTIYATGISVIDRQHKDLIGMLNHVVHNSIGHKERELLFFNETIDKGIKLLDDHFLQEEVLLENSNYPNLDSHIKEHTSLMGELKKMKQEIGNKEKVVDLFRLTTTLKDLLIDHILKYDVVAKDYLIRGLARK